MTGKTKPPEVTGLRGIKTGAAEHHYRGQPRALTGQDMGVLGVPLSFWRVTREGVPEAVRGVITALLDDIQTYLAEGITLLLRGGPGVGKTGIAVLLLKRARAWRHRGLFTTWRQLRDAKRNPAGAMFNAEMSLWDRALQVQVLVLDDITQDDVEDRYYGLDMLLAMLRDRAAEKKTTILTTKAPLDPQQVGYAERFPGIILATIPSVAALQVEGPNMTLAGNQALSAKIAATGQKDGT